MKLNNIFGWLGLSALMLTTACVRDDIAAGPSNENLADVYGTGSNVVTLTVNAATATGTRADEDIHISDGNRADLLLFEVYDLSISGTETTRPVYVPLISKKVDEFPVTIRLAVDPTHEYKVAFWAQHDYAENPESNPFTIDTTTFLKVKVDYNKPDDAINAMNDEYRDAFCANLPIAQNSKTSEVVLHRPFAQLNVGTTGADYKNYMEGNIKPNRTIAFSRMVINGVYDTIDVANDEISGKVDSDVELKLAKLPAFINYDTFDGILKADANDNEEFLRVNLNADDPAYRTEYPTIDEEGNYLTETFRYMAMAYVLVADGTGYYPNEDNDFKNPGGKQDEDTYKSSTLDKVEVYFAEAAKGADGKYTGEPTTEYKYFTVRNVPVHRNWRTNLLGGLSATDDPEDPDDETSIFYNTKICVHLCPIYFGEYNGVNDPDKEGGFNGIFSGYFPTGDNDLHDGKHKDQQPAGEE